MKYVSVILGMISALISSICFSEVSINGKTYVGNSISISDGVVIIDGQKVESNERKLEIEFVGNVGSVSSDQSVTIRGNVLGNVQANGSVDAEDIGKDVVAGGSVNASDIGGSVRADGSVNASDISGSVEAGGSIYCKSVCD